MSPKRKNKGPVLDWDSLKDEGKVTCPECRISIDHSKVKKHWSAKHSKISDRVPKEIVQQLKGRHNRATEEDHPLKSGRPHDLSAAFEASESVTVDGGFDFEAAQEELERIEAFPNAGKNLLDFGI